MKRVTFFITLLFSSSYGVDKGTYFKELQEIDFDDVKADLTELMTNSQDYWPADSGNYAGLMVRLAWHCAGSYRRFDGEGGCDGGRMRFLPEQAWADNTNLDKARTLLEPIKQKYGVGLSYGDLYILAGNVAIESTGGKVLGFCAGRVDDDDGSESEVLGPSDLHDEVSPCSEEEDGECDSPKGATTNELIYVNPAGKDGSGDPDSSVDPIKDTFDRMGMSPREAAALIGAHTLGKTHGACPTGAGPSPREDPENPWPGTCGSGRGEDTFTSGFEGPWTTNPDSFDNSFFRALNELEFEAEQSPADNPQFRPVNVSGEVANIRMLVADIALTRDDEFSTYVELYASDNELFNSDFADAWYKLTTRDMGPRSRCFGDDIPPAQPFQGEDLANQVIATTNDWETSLEDSAGLSEEDLPLAVEAAFRCAATFRASDNFGGCNGARILLEPERSWSVNEGIADFIEGTVVSENFPASNADQIVFAGTVALETLSGNELDLTFCPGRTDATSGEVSQNLEMFQFEDSRTQILRETRLLGLDAAGYTALAGRPRSLQYMTDLGYTGTYAGAAEFGTGYFDLLYQEELNWERTGVTGPLGAEFVDSSGSNYITERDYALLLRPEYRAAVIDFSLDYDAFMQQLVVSWTSLMSADRFDGPAENLCDNGSVDLFFLNGEPGTENANNEDEVEVFILLAALVVFTMAVGLVLLGKKKNMQKGRSFSEVVEEEKKERVFVAAESL
eukprot:maker-scaffold_1-snap-gene-17.4-mRNA-1 protein AED:0.07 eAED:0.07 QI:0/0/0/1/1/1/3/0/733